MREQTGACPDPQELKAAIERFLSSAKNPTLIEPGEDPFALAPGQVSLEIQHSWLLLQVWDASRNIVRRLTRLDSEKAGRIDVVFERFGRRTGKLSLVDLARPDRQEAGRRSYRQAFREQFRRFLRRQFPGWQLAELSTEPDLQHSLSPAYPRAMLRKGTSAWAAIASPPGHSDPAGCLTFGLIWLEYLRRREPRLCVGGLAVFVPRSHHLTTALRMRLLNPDAARYLLFLYDENGFEEVADLADCGNLQSSLHPWRRPDGLDDPLVQRLQKLEHVEVIPANDGALHLRVRGLTFAVYREGKLVFGAETKTVADASNLTELERIAAEISRLRAAEAPDRRNPVFLKRPEAWLESSVRASLLEIDPVLLPSPVYGQVPAFAGGDRDVLDLLAVERKGRLVVVELKTTADPHLPLQALDYWMRVDWHARRGDFTAFGYFPGVPLSTQPPRLLLVSPAMCFHPTTQDVLRYLSPEIEVERVGLNIEWQRRLKVLYRVRGARSAQWTAAEQERGNGA
ncbi:MAG: hypothetical protein IRZ15_17175 [Bryobacteraceae bacterium]|nr:hypothetical protein [Bryobacteraceae bacterium]